MSALRLGLTVGIAVVLAAGPGLAQPADPGPAATPRRLVIGTRHVPPFAIKKANGTWEGISIDLWRQIATQLNVPYDLRELPLQGLLDGLKDGSLDAAVAALTITADREEAFDFTHAFHSSGLGIAVSRASRNGWVTVLDRFTSLNFAKIVLALTAVLFLAGTGVWIFERRRNPEEFGGEAPKGLGAAFWWSAVTMTTVGYGDKSPKTLGGRLIALIWMFASVIIISGLTAAIASSLTVTQLETPVKGPADLPKVRTGTVRTSTSETYLRSHRIAFQSYDQALDGLQAIVTGSIDAMVYDAPIMRYLANTEYQTRLTVLPKTFERQYYAIGLPQGSALREPINRLLVRTISTPAWQDVLYRYLGE